MIMNEEENIYLNFYGAESKEDNDKFAWWDELDINAYMSLYKLTKRD